MSEDDSTLVQRVVRKVRGYDGPDKRESSPIEWYKYAPIVLAVLAGVMGYARLQAKVEALDEHRREHAAAMKEAWTDQRAINQSVLRELRKQE